MFEYQIFSIVIGLAIAAAAAVSASADPAQWRAEWPKTDFSKAAVEFTSILSGGPPKDGIPSIDRPKFETLKGGDFPDGIEPMERVVAVEVEPGRYEAWQLNLLRDAGEIRAGDLVIRWEAGQASALDAVTVAGGRDVGNVIVQQKSGD